jgi:hypothetical protein
MTARSSTSVVMPAGSIPGVVGEAVLTPAGTFHPTHVMPSRPLHCHVCGTEEKLAYVCPEHGPRCWAHVPTHEFCSHPKMLLAGCVPPLGRHMNGDDT